MSWIYCHLSYIKHNFSPSFKITIHLSRNFHWYKVHREKPVASSFKDQEKII
jgi:hypothetical protein